VCQSEVGNRNVEAPAAAEPSSVKVRCLGKKTQSHTKVISFQVDASS